MSIPASFVSCHKSQVVSHPSRSSMGTSISNDCCCATKHPVVDSSPTFPQPSPTPPTSRVVPPHLRQARDFFRNGHQPHGIEQNKSQQDPCCFCKKDIWLTRQYENIEGKEFDVGKISNRIVLGRIGDAVLKGGLCVWRPRWCEPQRHVAISNSVSISPC